jgi:carboxypeptidase D
MYSQTFLAHIDSVAARCNYSNYIEKHLKYPPEGPLPLPGASPKVDPHCDVWDEIVNAAVLLNPGFNVYHIFDTVSALLRLSFMSTVRDTFSQWPIMSDVLP